MPLQCLQLAEYLGYVPIHEASRRGLCCLKQPPRVWYTGAPCMYAWCAMHICNVTHPWRVAWHGSTHGIDEAADWIGLANLTVSRACATKTVYGASRVPLLLARCSLHCTVRRARQAHALAPPEPARQSTRCRHRMVTSPAAEHHCCRFKQKRLP